MEITFEEKIIWDRYRYNRNDGGLVLTYSFEITGSLSIRKLENALKKTVLYFSDSLLNSYTANRFGI